MNNPRTSARTVLLVILGLVIVLIVLLVVIKPGDKKRSDPKEAAVPVVTMTVQLTNTVDVVQLPAFVRANVDAVLAAEKSGRVLEINVDRGDRVEQGQLLLQIDDRVWQANLRQANSAAEDARKTRVRFQQLQASGAVAESEFDRIEKAFIQAESLAEEARINIEQCRVLSPISGIINDRFIEMGEYVQPGTPVLQVVDSATVKIILLVPEQDIYAIQTGDRMDLSVQPLPERMFTGTVTFIAAQADERNNAFRTEIVVDNSDATLRPGMIAQVNFKRGENRAMVSLPMSAVLPSKGDHIVYLAENGQASRRKVQIDTITRRQALISGGLDEGELVIIEGHRALSDGQRIELITEPPRGQ